MFTATFMTSFIIVRSTQKLAPFRIECVTNLLNIFCIAQSPCSLHHADLRSYIESERLLGKRKKWILLMAGEVKQGCAASCGGRAMATCCAAKVAAGGPEQAGDASLLPTLPCPPGCPLEADPTSSPGQCRLCILQLILRQQQLFHWM